MNRWKPKQRWSVGGPVAAAVVALLFIAACGSPPPAPPPPPANPNGGGYGGGSCAGVVGGGTPLSQSPITASLYDQSGVSSSMTLTLYSQAGGSLIGGATGVVGQAVLYLPELSPTGGVSFQPNQSAVTYCVSTTNPSTGQSTAGRLYGGSQLQMTLYGQYPVSIGFNGGGVYLQPGISMTPGLNANGMGTIQAMLNGYLQMTGMTGTFYGTVQVNLQSMGMLYLQAY